MLEAFFQAFSTTSVTPENFFICFGAALLCGIIVALAASFKSRVSKSFFVSLILLPLIVHTVITMVNGNIGTGVAVMGAFSLVRFRSVPGKARDIVSIFLAMTSGLACAAGYVGIALIFTVLVCGIMILLSLIPWESRVMTLRITVPESLKYNHEFDDIFKEYTTSFRLTKAKTTNMGSLYKLYFTLKMKDPDKGQEMIDKLRTRNGNLEISLADSLDNPEEL